VDEISKSLGVEPASIMRDIAELQSAGLISVTKRQVMEARLTDEGRRYASLGLPERRLLEFLRQRGVAAAELGKVARDALNAGALSSAAELRLAIQHLVRAGVCRVSEGRLVIDQGAIEEGLRRISEVERALSDVERSAAGLSEGVLRELRRRKLVTVKKRTIIVVQATDRCLEALRRGALRPARVVTRVTPDIILERKWGEVIFKRFDVSVEVPTVYPSRKHPYMELLDEVREILVSMGFEEMRGPHVELEFWNFDALFQAQDHPAREIHDTFFLKHPRTGSLPDRELMERVKLTHEMGWVTGSKGWGYEWSPERALRLVLRTQTTAVSVRTLYERGDGEYRCFALDRVFRPETLDAKHSMEFYQLEGIIVGRNVTFKHLLGFFEEFARRLGLGRVKIKPAYFPFTEPSVEGFIKHPKLGWVEVFPGGMFRPEVLLPLGVRESNVAAWGIGIDRIAMAVLGIDDIRQLFSPDLSFLREKPVPLVRSLAGW